MSTPTPAEPIDPGAGNPPTPAPAPATPPAPAADPAAPPAPGDGNDPALAPEGEKALAIWKQRAKDAEALSKDQAARLQAYEDAQKTEAERQADALKDAQARAEAATKLAVSSKVEAMAAGRFQDPLDAVEALQGGAYVGDNGLVDTDAIETALADLLNRKPHWAATEPGPRIPRPDPAQGARPGTPPNLAQQNAEAEKAGDLKKAMALKTQQLREIPTPASK